MSDSNRYALSSSRASEAASSDRNLSTASLHFDSPDKRSLAESRGALPVSNTTMNPPPDNNEGDEATIPPEYALLFPSRFGGPDVIPHSASFYFTTSGPHQWFYVDVEERLRAQHPLHGYTFSLYYGPAFRQPRKGWTGDEREDWLQSIWDWCWKTTMEDGEFFAWSRTAAADAYWKRRLRDKACQYYVEFGTLEGTVLESKEPVWGPLPENEPDVYALRNYLRRVELDQILKGPEMELDSEDAPDISKLQVADGPEDGGSAHSEPPRESEDAPGVHAPPPSRDDAHEPGTGQTSRLGYLRSKLSRNKLRGDSLSQTSPQNQQSGAQQQTGESSNAKGKRHSRTSAPPKWPFR